MTATLKDVRKVAATFGAKVTDDKSGVTHECNIEAPYRHKWACADLHMLVDCSYRPWTPAYDDLISRMRHGLVPCTDAECDWCTEERP